MVSRTAGVDNEALCCCEYKNREGETSHILACCCDCSALDDSVDRCVRCAPVPSGRWEAVMATVSDRLRMPWAGGAGAVQLQCDVALPILVIPTLFVLATMHEFLTLAVCLLSPAALLIYYRIWRRHSRRTRTRFFFAWSLTSTFTCFYVFCVAAFSFREILLWEMLIVYTLFGCMLYMLYLVKCDPGALRPDPGAVRPDSGDSSGRSRLHEELSLVTVDNHNDSRVDNTHVAGTDMAASANSVTAGAMSVSRVDLQQFNATKRSRTLSENLPESEVTWVDSRPLKDGLLRTYCDKCHISQPRRASHCTVCQQCIELRDHHCIWLDQCIGRRNHRAFLIAMVLFVVNGSYASHLMLTSMCTPEMYMDWFLFPEDCRFVYSDFFSAVAFVSCCYALTAVFLVAAALLQQVVLVSQNTTVQEFNAAARRGWVRYAVLATNNVHNGGFAQNWVDFLKSSRKHHYHHHHLHTHHRRAEALPSRRSFHDTT